MKKKISIKATIAKKDNLIKINKRTETQDKIKTIINIENNINKFTFNFIRKTFIVYIVHERQKKYPLKTIVILLGSYIA